MNKFKGPLAATRLFRSYSVPAFASASSPAVAPLPHLSMTTQHAVLPLLSPPSPSSTAACHYAVAGGKPVRCCVSGIHTVCAVRLMRCGVHSGCAAPVASCAPRLPLYPRCLPCLLRVATMRATAPATPGAPTPLVMILVPWRDGAVCAAPPPKHTCWRKPACHAHGASAPTARNVHDGAEENERLVKHAIVVCKACRSRSSMHRAPPRPLPPQSAVLPCLGSTLDCPIVPYSAVCGQYSGRMSPLRARAAHGRYARPYALSAPHRARVLRSSSFGASALPARHVAPTTMQRCLFISRNSRGCYPPPPLHSTLSATDCRMCGC